jgi:hypothetical protein
MRDFDAALGHHLHKISIRQPIGDVPAHAQLDDVGVEGPLAVNRVTGYLLRHSAPLQGRRIVLDAPECTRTTAAWTLQQLREAIGLQERYDYLLHDRDSIFAKHLDESMMELGVNVLKSPPRSPMANAIFANE